MQHLFSGRQIGYFVMWCRPTFLLLLSLAAVPVNGISLTTAAPPALTAVTAAGEAVPELRVAPATPRQGQALFVSTAGIAAAEPVTMTWDGKRYAIYSLGGGWRGVIPLQIEERPGKHTLRVTYRDSSGAARSLQRTVTVGRTPLRIQRLKMSRTTEKLYSYPGRAQELATVRRALRMQTPQQLWNGDFRLPSRGRFSTPFGVKRIRNGRHVGYHRGLDIAAPTGTPIHAAATGRVVLTRSLKMHGKTVVIDHGLGVTSLYIHQSALRCREGQSVRRGDPIGEVGMTGTATGPHLHWSIYVHGTAVSPLFWTKLPR
jgi:murein DD-endopeptidase MepM/ murein hydrolase activator NlpD